jgi:WD40 repeat protein
VDTVLRRATDPDAARRHPNAGAFRDDLHRALGDLPVVVAEPRNPFKGLRPFGEADAPDFFGRDDLIEDLAEAVANRRLVGVVGPSGSGKSSLVRAGLIPALRSGRLPGSDAWLIADVYPGADPFTALGETLRSVAVESVPDLADPGIDPKQFAAAVRSGLPPDAELVLIVDQFEELFTLCGDEHTRRRFMDVLLALTDDPDVGARVILTLRADYYGLLLQYRPMGEALRAAVVAITPLGSEQLRRAITGPAEAVGLEVEPELVADLVGDVAAEPGGLPLMEYALTRLFKERSGARLDVATYREMGGLSEALAGWPERLYRDLDESDREAARQLFLRLVSVDEAGQDSRRRVGLPELYGLGIDTAVVDRVIGGFVEARLVTFDSDPITRTPTVEVAHEALLERWGRLRDWIEVHRESLMLYRRFGGAHADWEHADRDPDYLLRGGRLRQFEAWSRETDLVLTEPEREYLLASRDCEDTAVATRRRRRNLIGAALGVLGAAVVVFGVFALIQRDRAGDQQAAAEEQAANAEEQAARAEGEAANAEEQAALAVQAQSRAEEQASIADEERGRAEEQERIARARSLAASAAANLEKDPELAVLLALEAVEMTRQFDGMVLREAEEALHAAVTANRLVSTVAVEQWARTVAYAPDGDHFYVGGRTSGRIVEALSGSIEGDIKVDIGNEMSVSNIAVMAIAGADDELLVVAHYGPGRISVLDAQTLEKTFTLEGGSAWVTDLDVSADGMILAGIDPYDGMVFIWDLEEQSRIAEFELDCDLGCSRGVALSRDGTVVTSGNTVWDVVTGEPLLALDGPADDVEMIDERRMIRGDGILVHVVDIVTKEILQTLRGHSAEVTSIDVTADGRMAATGSQDGLVLLWDLDSLESSPVMTLPAQRGTVWEVKFAPDGRYLTSVAGLQQLDAGLVDTWPTDWEARTWDISAAGSREWMGCATRDGHVAFGPAGDLVVVADPDTGAGVWDIASGTKTVVLGGRAGGSEVTATAFAPDGSEIVLGGIMPSQGGETGTLGWVAVFDPTTGEMIRELVPPTPEVVPKDLTYSDDGSRLGLVGTGLALVWDTTSWSVSTNLSDLSEATAYTAIAFHPDKRYLITQFNPYSDWGFPSGHLWDLDGGKVQYEYGHSPRAGRGDVAVSPNGRLLVTVGVGRPALMEPFTGRELARLEGAPSHAASVAFSPDGTRIATGEADGTVRLWDAATGEQSMVLTGHTAMVVDVAFSPDGSRLASVGLDGAMRVWALHLDDLLVIARSSVERQLTDVECRAFVGEGCAPAPGLERLIPATAGWEGPYGIDATAWEAAGAGGEWVEGPPGIAGTLAFDPSSRRMVVFEDYVGTWLRGREAEVWEAGAPMPPAPESWSAVGSVGPVVYHGGLGMVVTTRVDDGTTFGYDTRADSWSELHSPVEALIRRYGYGIAYDEESDLVVLFGGAEWGRTDQGKHVGFGDTWVFDAAAGTWTDVTPDISPPPRIQPVMVYDTQSDRIVLFGGHTKVNGDVLGDTWVYDTNTNSWRESQPQVTPPARSDSAAWYDSKADITFVFGGSTDRSSYPPLPWMALGGEELWGYDLETDTWTLFRVDPNPGYTVSVYLVAVFDAESGEAILNGTDGFDEDRRFQGWREGMWTYRHDGG